MPFLLADDAADEATRRLQDFGDQQLSNLSSLRQGAQDLGASAQDATQRLMSFGQQQLSSSLTSLQPPPNPIQALPTPDVGAVTDRLHAFGEQALTSATQGLQRAGQQAQQGIQQLQPLQPLAPPAAPSAPQNQSLDQPQQPAPQQGQPLDKNGVIAYVQQKARDFGLDPAAVLAVANQEGLNTDPGSHWQLPGEKNISFGPPSWYGNGAGADIIAKHGDDAARWSWTPEGIDYWLGQVQTAAQGLSGPDAVAAIVNKFERPREDLAAGEIEKAKAAYNQFTGGVQQKAADLTQTVQQGAQNLTGQSNTSGLVFPVVGYQGDINDHWGSVKGGSDIMADRGTPVVAMRGGKVIESGWNSVGGNSVLVQADDGNQYYYAHFDKAPSVKVGDTISAGTYLGPVGNTGDASGGPTHLHIGIGPDIKLGADKYGGTGGDYDAVDLLKQAQAGQQNQPAQAATTSAAGPQALAAPVQQGAQNVANAAGQAANQGLEVLGRAAGTAGDLATGGLTRRFNENLQGLGSDLTAGGTQSPFKTAANALDQVASTADTVAPGGGGLVPSDLMRVGANFLRSPGVLDSVKILQDLNNKYGSMDSSTYSPEDQRAAGQALVAVGGVVGGGGAPEASRMYHGTGADFPRVDPQAVSGEENLFGPGYYLTSDPRVAGGVVSQGGNRIPMNDATGAPIQHQATVIFPESLEKVTNATAGTPGGQVAAPFALGTGAAVGAGALAANKDRINDALQGWQAPFTLDDVKDKLDDLGSKLEDFRQQQAATSPIQPGGFTAPVARGLEAANDVLQQRTQNLDPAQITQDYLDAIRSGDVGGILDAAARGADVAAGPAGTSLADVSAPLSAGLTAAGVDPNLSRVLGMAGNLVAPAALEGAVGRGLPQVAGGLARGEAGTLGDFLANEDGSLNLDKLGRVLQATRVGALAGGLPTLAHIALNTPVQIGTKLASDLGANVRYPEATAAELYGAMQGLRAWGMNAASTLNKPGPLASSMGATSTLSLPGAGETALTGLVKLHPVLQDIPKQMANYMELYRTAAQQATDAGLPRMGTRWRAEVARLVSSPTSAMQSAANFAAGTAGLSGGMGTTGTAISKLIHDAPLARFAMPIFDIGYKIASKGVEMTPTMGPIGTAWDVARGLTGSGPYAGGNWGGRGANEAVTPLAERVRNHLIGLALMYEGYQQAAQGNITGEGPSDPGEQAALRQTGWQPSSVKLGGRYFDAHLLGQLGWPLIAGANLYEARNGPGGQGLPPIKTPQGEQQPGVLDELGDYVARQGRYFNDETFLRGVGDILNLMGSGFQQGKVPQQEAAGVLQSLVPQGALGANWASSQDPFQRNPRAGANPLEDIQNALLARLPGQREGLQTRISATGRQLANPQQGLGILMPRSSVVQGDPILDELAKVGVKPTNTPVKLSFGSANEVQLTPGEQYRWQQYRGQALTDSATKLMSSSAYKKLDDGSDKGKIAQRNAVAAVVSSSAQVADGKLRQELAKDTTGLTRRFIATGSQAPAYGYGTGGYTPLSQPLSEQTGQ
jgi:murein DD-endopeptidase MepM/ murein hydrolase activator NlpD